MVRIRNCSASTLYYCAKEHSQETEPFSIVYGLSCRFLFGWMLLFWALSILFEEKMKSGWDIWLLIKKRASTSTS